MKVPFSWLTEYCDTGLEPGELADRLAMTGTEVERVTGGSGQGSGLVVGRTISVEPHPDADRLSVCQVDDGTGNRTIVCGAPNVAAGQTVVVALPGTVMPNGMEIGEAKLRGVLSSGMICSEEEIGLGTDADGILVLEEEVAPGTPATEALPLDEAVLELEVTPNRPDCLSVYGVAREVHAVTGAELAPEPWEKWSNPGPGEAGALASVTIEEPMLCPRFTLSVFRDVKVEESPAWLRQRLAAAGQRSVNNVVDVTNYVMLLTGQPLHAFDLDKVPGGELFVRGSKEGESIATLDGVERFPEPGTALVCDRNGPTAIAGIMGGAESEVSTSTKSVLLEVATWNGPGILRASRELGLRSEASNRFEKGLHPELASRAQAVAAELMVDLCGATVVPGMVDEGAGVAETAPIELGLDRVREVIGMDVPPREQQGILERLGFDVEETGSALRVTVSPDRAFDLTREIDLVEEIARISDLDSKLPATLPATSGGGFSRGQVLRRRGEDAMLHSGFDEIVSLSFVSRESVERLGLDERDDPRARPIELSNPLSEEQAVMRTTLLTSLLDAAASNVAHGAGGVRLFESGRVYLPVGDGAIDKGVSAVPGDRPAPAAEPLMLGALASGSLLPADWRGQGVPADFHSLKGVLEEVIGSLGLAMSVAPGSEPFLHPGKSATVLVDGVDLGWLGEVHPTLVAEAGLDDGVAFEVDFERLVVLSPAGREVFHEVPTLPSLERDLALSIADSVPAGEVADAIREAGGDLLEDVRLFDRYTGDQVEEGQCSLAFSLRFRAPDRTLSDEEVDPCWEAIVAAVKEMGGTPRG